jgi:hypothetical protein
VQQLDPRTQFTAKGDPQEQRQTRRVSISITIQLQNQQKSTLFDLKSPAQKLVGFGLNSDSAYSSHEKHTRKRHSRILPTASQKMKFQMNYSLHFSCKLFCTPKCTLADDSLPSQHGNNPRETKSFAKQKKKTI